MRRFGLLVSVVAVALLGILALHAQPVAIAQEATPSAEEMAGETFDPLGFALGVSLPSPADMFVARFTFEPGAGFRWRPATRPAAWWSSSPAPSLCGSLR